MPALPWSTGSPETTWTAAAGRGAKPHPGPGPFPCAELTAPAGPGAPWPLGSLLPPSQDLRCCGASSPRRFECERLRRQGAGLLSYHGLTATERGRRRALSMLWTLAEGLGSGQRRLQRPRSRRREAAGGSWRGSEPARYPRFILRCLGHAAAPGRGHRPRAQPSWTGQHPLPEVKLQRILKIRLEELNVLLDTYSPERVEVHRAIRASLQGGVQQQEQELATAQKILATYESLGPEFEGLVQEYAQLCGGIENKRWALHEFNKGSH
nr:HAUS augmin-like complex subunit 4 isoform X1 [Chelonoidis abingdonii]